MPWEVTIVSSMSPAPQQLSDAIEGSSLGDVQTVRSQLAAALPGVQFYMEPSGMEEIRAAEKAGIEFPDIIKKHYLETPEQLQADYEASDFSFYFGHEQTTKWLDLEVRGSGDPIPTLCSIAEQTGWLLYDCASYCPSILNVLLKAGVDSRNIFGKVCGN